MHEYFIGDTDSKYFHDAMSNVATLPSCVACDARHRSRRRGAFASLYPPVMGTDEGNCHVYLYANREQTRCQVKWFHFNPLRLFFSPRFRCAHVTYDVREPWDFIIRTLPGFFFLLSRRVSQKTSLLFRDIKIEMKFLAMTVRTVIFREFSKILSPLCVELMMINNGYCSLKVNQ